MNPEAPEQRRDAERERHDQLRSEYIVIAYLRAHPERPLARQVANGQQTIESATELMNEFVRDPKTGVLRTDYLTYAIEFENLQSKELEQPYTIALFDLDNFKALNTELGYDTVDQLLELVAKRIVRTVRQSDEVATAEETEIATPPARRTPLGDSTIRYGGEEFLVIFSAANQAEARMGAERVRTAIQDDPDIQTFLREHGSTVARLTVSAGLAEHQPDQEQAWKTLIATANEQLDGAKESGKNAVFPRLEVVSAEE